MKKLFLLFLIGIGFFSGISVYSDSSQFEDRLREKYNKDFSEYLDKDGELKDEYSFVADFDKYKENLKKIGKELGGDPHSFENIGGLYYKDKSDMYYIFGKIEGVDYDSFQVLSNIYAKDKNTVYYEQYPITGAVTERFNVDVKYPNTYGYDDSNYYMKGIKIPSKKSATDTLTESCVLLNNLFIKCYNTVVGFEEFFSSKKNGELINIKENLYQDDKYVYNLSLTKSVIISDTPNGLQVLNDMYFKDNKKVWFSSESGNISEMEGVDVGNFKVFRDSNNKGYEFASDGSNIYYYGSIDSDYAISSFNINAALKKEEQEFQDYAKKGKLIMIYSFIYSLILSFIIYFTSFHLMMKNKGISMNISSKLLLVGISLAIINIFGYIFGEYIESINEWLYIIISSLIGSCVIILITKIIFKEDVRVISDTLKLGGAAVLLGLLLGFVMALLIGGTFLATYLN